MSRSVKWNKCFAGGGRVCSLGAAVSSSFARSHRGRSGLVGRDARLPFIGQNHRALQPMFANNCRLSPKCSTNSRCVGGIRHFVATSESWVDVGIRYVSHNASLNGSVQLMVANPAIYPIMHCSQADPTVEKASFFLMWEDACQENELPIPRNNINNKQVIIQLYFIHFFSVSGVVSIKS